MILQIGSGGETRNNNSKKRHEWVDRKIPLVEQGVSDEPQGRIGYWEHATDLRSQRKQTKGGEEVEPDVRDSGVK